jgi:hypothetical protein
MSLLAIGLGLLLTWMLTQFMVLQSVRPRRPRTQSLRASARLPRDRAWYASCTLVGHAIRQDVP